MVTLGGFGRQLLVSVRAEELLQEQRERLRQRVIDGPARLGHLLLLAFFDADAFALQKTDEHRHGFGDEGSDVERHVRPLVPGPLAPHARKVELPIILIWVGLAGIVEQPVHAGVHPDGLGRVLLGIVARLTGVERPVKTAVLAEGVGQALGPSACGGQSVHSDQFQHVAPGVPDVPSASGIWIVRLQLQDAAADEALDAAARKSCQFEHLRKREQRIVEPVPTLRLFAVDVGDDVLLAGDRFPQLCDRFLLPGHLYLQSAFSGFMIGMCASSCTVSVRRMSS